MTEANLTLKMDSYSNPDAIENTISYINRLENPYKYYYGVWPPSTENAIRLFHQTREMFPQNTCSQQVQHLIISFRKLKDIGLICQFANQIALLFSENYPVCYALHDDTEHLHIHFIISATSYIPNVRPLMIENLSSFIPELRKIAFSHNINIKEVIKKMPK